jgi:hypothetical protein
MKFIPTPPVFDMARHIEILKTKRETIVAFVSCTAKILAYVVDKNLAAHWGNHLRDWLCFDVDQSIVICEQEQKSQPENLTRALISLTEQRKQSTRELDQFVKAMEQIIRIQSGEDPSPGLLEVMAGPKKKNIAALDAQITHIQSQLVAMEKPKPANGG